MGFVWVLVVHPLFRLRQGTKGGDGPEAKKLQCTN